MTSLIRHILDQSEALGNKPAFIHDEDGKSHTLSYHNFRRLVLAFSKAIQKEDIPYKSRVLLLGENSPKWPAAYLGAHLCGLTVIHGDVRFTEAELQRIMEFTDPSLILCDKSFAKYFKKATKKILLDDVSPLHQDPVPRIIPLAPEQAMSIILTSGTTGSPKGVMLNESNFMSNISMFESMKGFVSSRDRLVAILPLHHVYPFTCTVLAPLYIGATLIYPQSLKGEDIFGAIKNHGGTILIAIPRVLELFCNRIFDRVAQLPTMKRCIF
jgi:long-chain acyl-CoA synthetase